MIKVNMDKARAIHMDRIREARQIKFEELGFPKKINAEVEAVFVSEELRNQLQELRDIPQTFDLNQARTPEELKLLWPEQLIKEK